MDSNWQVTMPVEKVDEAERLVFGWANVPFPIEKGDKPKVDLQNDRIYLDDLEKAVYDYVEFSGEGDEMHTEPVVARVVESFIVTPEKMAKMGLSEGTLPLGWWIGLRVLDDAAFEKVRNGTYKMFSIGGSAIPIEESV